MSDWEEKRGTATVPAGSGWQGILRTIEAILKLPKVQGVTIDARGRVDYKYLVKGGQPEQALGIDLESLQPYMVVRNCDEIRQVPIDDPKESAGLVMARLFRAAQIDQLIPIAFVTGTNSKVWDWWKKTTGTVIWERRDEFWGYPLYTDRHVPDEALLLCAGYLRNSTLLDTKITYSLSLGDY